MICGKQAWNAHQELGLLYEDDRRDFVPRGPVEGVQGMARRLRDSRPNAVEWELIAEELEDMGGSLRRELLSRLTTTSSTS